MAEELSTTDAPSAIQVFQAEMGYISDPARRSLEHWYRSHAAKVIGWSSFRRRASVGRWNQRRSEFWNEVSGHVIRQQAENLALAQLQELRQLEAVRSRVLDELSKLAAGPMSLDKCVRALVQIDKRIDDKRSAVLERIEPLKAKEEEQVKESPFDVDEIRLMARTLLEHRRQKQSGQVKEAAVGE